MDGQIWSWILGAVGVVGFVLAGKKVWWAWYINIANQFLWTAYSFITEQWGFLVTTAVFFFVFCRNAYTWTKEHFAMKRAMPMFQEAYITGESVKIDIIRKDPLPGTLDTRGEDDAYSDHR